METLSFESMINSSIKTGFLLKPVFLHGISFSLHLVMFLSLFFSWSCQNLRRFRSEGKNQRSVKSSKIVHRKKILIACVSVSSFNFFLMCSFMSYNFSWSESALFPVLDFSVKTFSWGTLALYYYYYVYSHFPSSKHPLLVRLWWGIYFCVSLYCLVIHVILFKRRVIAVQPLLSDLVSVVTSSLCLVYLETLERNDSLLGEPLLKKKKGDESVTPYSKAGFLSCLTFSWIEPLIAHGYKKTLDLEDLPRLAPEDTASVISPMVMSLIESDQKPMSSIKLARVVFSLLRGEILWMAVLLIASKIASYAGPYLIDGFFQYLNGKEGFENKGFSLASAFIAAKLVECLSQLQWFFVARKIRVKACASLVSLIYDKSLVLSSGSKNGKSSGEIINLMTVDTERIADFAFFVHDPWTVILEIGLATAILYRSLGLAAAITTLVSTVLITLANLPLGKLQERFQKKLMESKDSRMRAISEILKNMRILKLQGWEMKFLSRILEQRKIETSWLKKFLYSKAITSFMFKISPAIVSVVAFGTCVILDIPLDSGKVLSALATFKILQGPINKLPDTISMIAQTKVSFERISTFLRLRELPLDLGFRISEGSYSDIAVEISNGNFSWDENPTLKDVNLRVIHGSKVAICGSVGSGKSSLLSAMLGEIPRISGYVEIFGRKAYVAQSPWIQSGTIEENVLFGSEMEREKYERVLNACSLKKDLESFSFGDRTVIGERGINLSGGQKQRVQIARALYQDAEIYLFDDPFSAVDAHTGSHLFKECLMGLLSSKTVIYVTHQVEFLPSADLILVMKDGQISQAGKYKEILESETDFIKLVGAHMEALSSLDSIGERDHSPITNKEQKKTIQNKKQEDITTEPKGQLVREEERQRGRVGSSVYRKYISTVYKGALVPLILLSQVMFQAFQIASNYWMASASPAAGDSSLPGGGVESSRLVLVYTALSMGSSVFVLSRTTLLVTAGYKTATRLFNDMHRCIFRAPMSFFDSTPSARILNRASTDQSTLDLSIFFQVGSFAFCVIQLLGIVAVMSQAAWQVFVVFFPVIAACIWYQQYYLPCARELSRLIGICKAPVIQHFAETISGVVTIRGFDQGPRFRHTNMNLTDLSSRPKFHYAAAMEWLCFRLDMLSVTTFAFSLFFLISVPKGFINPGIAGLVITYGLNLNSLQAHLIWTLCNIENKIISVERILQYTTISSEPPLTVESKRPDHSWPLHGEVEIRDLQVRYALHLPLVLRGITCTFGGGTKTGIVGRTGSGKSTLIQTLFRIIDPDFGHIVIDGIDISSIGLHDLRSRLSIIPQDPTMFEGTVRSNLDPLEEYTDDQIWEVLDKCQLGDEVRKKEEKLYSSVTENGENWSMGQRQLVCLGRVLLKKSKVLVLDEATASVDTATDNLIQQTLRQHFSRSTVITIAHRITSVIDSDMVLLLSHGVIEEHDSPERLLQNKSSSFSQLVAEYTLRSNHDFSDTSA